MTRTAKIHLALTLTLMTAATPSALVAKPKKPQHPPRETLSIQLSRFISYAKGVGGAFPWFARHNIDKWGRQLGEATADHVVTTREYVTIVMEVHSKFPHPSQAPWHEKELKKVRAMISGMRTNLASLADEGPGGTEDAAEDVVRAILQLARHRSRPRGRQQWVFAYTDAVNRALRDNEVTDEEIPDILRAQPPRRQSGGVGALVTNAVTRQEEQPGSRREIRRANQQLREALQALSWELRDWQ